MITRNPYDRDDIKINRKNKVLEIGPGHNPTFRDNVVVERFIDSNCQSLSSSNFYQCKWRNIAI